LIGGGAGIGGGAEKSQVWVTVITLEGKAIAPGDEQTKLSEHSMKSKRHRKEKKGKHLDKRTIKSEAGL